MNQQADINLTDLAEQLGLSIPTVSRALRGLPGINKETRRKVQQLAERLGYSKHLQKGQARERDARKLRHVMVLSETGSSQTDLGYMEGMSAAAVGETIAIQTHIVPFSRCESVLDPKAAPVALRAGLVKGVVLLHRWPVEVARAISGRFPTVSVVHDYPGCEIDQIGIEERRSMLEIVTHLLAGGHKKIGFFGFCPQVSWSCARHAAYFEALMRQQLGFEPLDTVRVDLDEAIASSPFSPRGWGDQVVARLKKGVDAWVCPSALTALSLRIFFLNRGLKIPDDVCLTGFHHPSGLLTGELSAVTTTQVSDEVLGYAAIRRLVARMANPKESRQTILFPAELVLGASTRKPIK